MSKLAVFSFTVAVVAMSGTSLAALSYNTQVRNVQSNAGVSALPNNWPPVNNAIVSASDFAPFNQVSETISGGPSPNPSATGRASQQSSLLPDRVDFAGTVFAQDGNGSGGVGAGVGQSNLAVNFTLDAASDFAFDFTLSNPGVFGTTIRGYTVSLLDNSNTAVFNFTSTIGQAGNGPLAYTNSGNLAAGSYTLSLTTFVVAGGSGTSTATSNYQSSFVIPSAPAAACLLIPGIATLRRRRR